MAASPSNWSKSISSSCVSSSYSYVSAFMKSSMRLRESGVLWSLSCLECLPSGDKFICLVYLSTSSWAFACDMISSAVTSYCGSLKSTVKATPPFDFSEPLGLVLYAPKPAPSLAAACSCSTCAFKFSSTPSMFPIMAMYWLYSS